VGCAFNENIERSILVDEVEFEFLADFVRRQPWAMSLEQGENHFRTRPTATAQDRPLLNHDAEDCPA
jgi:hypothetical protein